MSVKYPYFVNYSDFSVIVTTWHFVICVNDNK